MIVRHAVPADINQIAEIFKTAKEYMIQTGNPTQWDDSYPSVEIALSDMDAGIGYVFEQDGIVHGYMAFILGPDPTYAEIEGGSWLNDEPYGTIHRIASDGQLPGIFNKAVEFGLTLTSNIRVDTHADNSTMQHLAEKYGFSKCGIIYVEDGSPRIAYHYENSGAAD